MKYVGDHQKQSCAEADGKSSPDANKTTCHPGVRHHQSAQMTVVSALSRRDRNPSTQLAVLDAEDGAVKKRQSVMTGAWASCNFLFGCRRRYLRCSS